MFSFGHYTSLDHGVYARTTDGPKLQEGDSKRICISKDTVEKIAQVGCSILVVGVTEVGYVSGCVC